MRALCLLLLPLSLLGCAIPIIGSSASRPQPRPSARADVTAPWLPSDSGACYARLAEAGVAFQPVPKAQASGVRMPTRLQGPLGGIEVHARARRSRHEVLDCRLALALLSWTPSLRRAGVTKLEHYSIYRPGARVGGSGNVSGHARGLAIDAARFYLDNGEVLDVLTDWEERERGADPCPLRQHESRPGRLLRSMVCDAVARNLFQVVLTPHHDRAHDNHVHLELKPGVAWTYVR